MATCESEYSASTCEGGRWEDVPPDADLPNTQGIQVGVRIRGGRMEEIINQEDFEEKGGSSLLESCIYAPHSKGLVEVHVPEGAQAGQTHVFRVDQVVNEDAGLEFAYNYTAHNLVKTVRRQGGSGTFISLGLPRSGKTFMMEGEMGDPGIVMRAIQELLACGHMIPRTGPRGRRVPRRAVPTWSLAMSHYEVHQERVYDLLNDREEVSVTEDGSGHVILDGLTEMHVVDVAMASDLLWQARSGRHELNHRSYSHSFTVLYLYREGGPMPKAIRHSVSGERRVPHAKLTFVDLAGREPASDIYGSSLEVEDSAWLYESHQAIQTCLSRHMWLQQAGPKLPLEVPCKSSKVTHIMKDVFVEGASLALCINLSPAAIDFREETLQLLEELSLPLKQHSSAPLREQTGPATLRPQPQRGAQNPKRPARALLPGDEVSTGPVTQKPARDPRVPRAEQLLDAAQDEAQRWRAQAMHLSEELQHAQSAAHSERQAYVAQLSGARTHLKYLGANSLDADQDVAYLTRELKQANAANSSLRAELSEALEACKVAQAATEKEAQRAADLEARNAAMQLQLAELLGRYKGHHKEDSGHYASAVSRERSPSAAAEADMAGGNRTAPSTPAPTPAAQQARGRRPAPSTPDASARESAFLSAHVLRLRQQPSRPAPAMPAVLPQEAGPDQAASAALSGSVAGPLASAEGSAAVQRDAQRASQQPAVSAAAQTHRHSSLAGADEATSQWQQATEEDSDAVILCPRLAAVLPAARSRKAARPRATSQVASTANKGGKRQKRAAHPAGPSACSAVAAQRAIPAKRAREEGASLAAAPELAAASVNQEVERRVRRRVARSTTVPDQGAASSVAAGSKPFTRAAAASQRRPPGLSPVPERLPAKGAPPAVGTEIDSPAQAPVKTKRKKVARMCTGSIPWR